MENNVPGRKSEAAAAGGPARRGRGRPRKWANDQERRAAARQRQREWAQSLEELYLALVNAQWEEPELARACAVAPDAEVVRILIAHFRNRPRPS